MAGRRAHRSGCGRTRRSGHSRPMRVPPARPRRNSMLVAPGGTARRRIRGSPRPRSWHRSSTPALGAEELDIVEAPAGVASESDRLEREHELARLGGGHPRPVRHAADPAAADHELRPTRAEATVRLPSRDDTSEHGVVPVHRPAALVEERVRATRDRVGQGSEGALPVLASVPDGGGDGHAAAHAAVKARGGGEQRALLGIVGAPRDRPRRLLLSEHERERRLDALPAVP